ncbi:ras-related protein Rab-37 isoform X3 [Chelonus insularis]|uniref:ras-related protein Rab-37 isoform X3 n=1 Tax=Chelonus insularis TaxID=460826 RepID=UPI00158E2927|nr:ras-related protein Rab-37 isoform X3 [Chelonus insularis]
MNRMEGSNRSVRSRMTSPPAHTSDWTATNSSSASRGPNNSSTTVGPSTGVRTGPARRQLSQDDPNSPQAPPEAKELHFKNKVVDVGDMRIKLQIWDTAGQERFRSVTHAYYRDAHALLLLYDVTNKTSFDNIRAWLSEIREYAQSDVVIMLLGNKTDCGNERVVKKEDGQRLADEYQVPFMETSAKTGVNVDLAFLAIARQLQARKSENPDETKFNVHEYVRQQSQSRSTCFSTNCQTT